jgi:hypothetical protein
MPIRQTIGELTIDDLPLPGQGRDLTDLFPVLPDGRTDLRYIASGVRPTTTGWQLQTPTTQIGDWLNANSTLLFMGAGALFLFALVKGRR